jgi:hypothetical protein
MKYRSAGLRYVAALCRASRRVSIAEHAGRGNRPREKNYVLPGSESRVLGKLTVQYGKTASVFVPGRGEKADEVTPLHAPMPSKIRGTAVEITAGKAA